MKDIREIKDYQIVLLGLIIALGAVLSTFILSHAVISYQKLNKQALSVTGSASRNVKSDLAVWKAYYEVRSKDLKSGYAKINADKQSVKEFLLSNGLKEEDIKFTPVSSYPFYKKLSNGYDSNDVDGYRLSQNVEVSSKDVDNLTKISQDAIKLVDKNVELSSNTVEYYVSNLDELKVQILADATKDAKERAKSMVQSTGGHIGVMNSAKMGVFQIVAENSTDVSDYGIYNTNAINKKINAVVNATFTIK
ncbi:MAG: SIMPL domain-containing protein [Clostridium sp.]|nr:SIMPL domain-containing protein [Clostridium sp.]